MLLKFSMKQLATLVAFTHLVVLAGWCTTLQAADTYDPLQDKEAVVFFKVIKILAGDVLNIRKSPTSKSKKVGAIPLGQHCIAYLNEIDGPTKQKTWVKITHKGVKGWASLNYLSIEEMGCGTYFKVINVRNHLNVRKSPYLYAKKVGEIPAHGECFLGVDTFSRLRRNWAMVRYSGSIRGWVNAKYLKKINVDECDV